MEQKNQGEGRHWGIHSPSQAEADATGGSPWPSKSISAGFFAETNAKVSDMCIWVGKKKVTCDQDLHGCEPFWQNTWIRTRKAGNETVFSCLIKCALTEKFVGPYLSFSSPMVAWWRQRQNMPREIVLDRQCCWDVATVYLKLYLFLFLGTKPSFLCWQSISSNVARHHQPFQWKRMICCKYVKNLTYPQIFIPVIGWRFLLFWFAFSSV